MPDETRSRVWFWRVWTAVGVLVLVWAFTRVFANPLRLLMPSIVLAFIIIYLLNPVVSWLERRHIPRLLGTAIAYLAAIGAMTGVVLLLIPLLAGQLADLADRVPEMASSIEDFVNTQLARVGIDQRISLDPSALETRNALQQFFDEYRHELMDLVRRLGSILAGVVAGLFAIILAPVLAFYALMDLPRLAEGVRGLLPPGSRSEVVDVSRRVMRTVGSYVRGQILVSMFVGTSISIGLAIIGLPFWALVGGIAGVGNLIPFVGPTIGGVLGVTIALTAGGGLPQAVLVIVVMVAVQQIDNNVITPGIISRTVQVHPVTIILALAVAAMFFGILGMLVVVPVLAAIKLVIVYLLVTRVPSMAHLGGLGPQVIDGVPVAEPHSASLGFLGRELRTAWDQRQRLRRRRQQQEQVVPDPTPDPEPDPTSDIAPGPDPD